MFFVVLIFVWLKSTYDFHILIVNFDDIGILVQNYVLFKIMREGNFFDAIVVHQEILHLIFIKLDFELCIELSFIVEIDNFAHYIVFNLVERDVLIFLILFNLSEHFFKS